MRTRAVVTMLALAVVAALPGMAGADEPLPDTFDVRAVGAPLTMEGMVPSVLPLRLNPGVGISSVRVATTPVVLALAGVVYDPVAEEVAGHQDGWCYSNYPGEPHEASCGGPSQALGEELVLSVGSGYTASTGDPSDASALSSEASTTIAGLHTTDAAPGVLRIGKVASAASMAPADNRVTAGASTALDEIVIDEVLTIRGLRSSVSAALTGAPDGKAADHTFAIIGAEVGGVPVTIGPEGVFADGEERSGPLGEGVLSAQEQVNEALQQAGLRVRLIEPTRMDSAEDGTGVTMTSGGIGISWVAAEDVLALPEAGPLLHGGRTDFILGRSSLRISAFQPMEFDLGFGGPDGSVAGPAPAAGSSSPGASGAADAPAVDRQATASSDADADPDAAPAAAPAAPAAPEPGAAAERVAEEAMAAMPITGDGGWSLVFPAFALLCVALPLLAGASRAAIVPARARAPVDPRLRR